MVSSQWPKNVPGSAGSGTPPPAPVGLLGSSWTSSHAPESVSHGPKPSPFALHCLVPAPPPRQRQNTFEPASHNAAMSSELLQPTAAQKAGMQVDNKRWYQRMIRTRSISVVS